MKVTLLGTGAPEPSARRASSGYLIEVGGERMLFDCGGGVFDRLLQLGVAPTSVSRLFLSHLHSDHMMDYARLVHARWDMGAPDLEVRGPAPIAEMTRLLFGPGGVFAADLTVRTEGWRSRQVWVERGGTLPRPWPTPQVTEIEPGFSMEGDGWRLTSVAVPHVQPYLTSIAFRLDADGRSVVYSGDCGPSKGLTALAKDADLLIHMCFQLSQDARGPDWLAGSSGHLEVAHTARSANVGTAVLTHLRPYMDAEGVHARMLEEMSEIHSGEIVVGEDLMVFDLASGARTARECDGLGAIHLQREAV